MYKRGISPIIATVLLVGFTIAMAAVVTNFLVEETQEKFNPENFITESEYCGNVALGYKIVLDNEGNSQADLIEVDGFDQLKGVELVNKGTFTVRKLTYLGPDSFSHHIAIVDTKGRVYDDGLEPNGKGEPLLIKFSGYDKEKDSQILKVIPWIMDPKKKVEVLCEESSLLIDLKQIDVVKKSEIDEIEDKNSELFDDNTPGIGQNVPKL